MDVVCVRRGAEAPDCAPDPAALGRAHLDLHLRLLAHRVLHPCRAQRAVLHSRLIPAQGPGRHILHVLRSWDADVVRVGPRPEARDYGLGVVALVPALGNLNLNLVAGLEPLQDVVGKAQVRAKVLLVGGDVRDLRGNALQLGTEAQHLVVILSPVVHVSLREPPRCLAPLLQRILQCVTATLVQEGRPTGVRSGFQQRLLPLPLLVRLDPVVQLADQLLVLGTRVVPLRGGPRVHGQ
mmetsp:Transcript_33454/g.92628  ORF Transcript_33454/g.92628 Transcript_33454/m.92628 type:complete len:238 (-) Transcript_33454:220-933(-)